MNTLSICIPSYNRCNYLKNTLEIILGQIEALPIRLKQICKVYVYNNGSTDETHHLLSVYQSQYPETLITLGSNRNIAVFSVVLDLLAASSSKYCWIFGDDDLIPDLFLHRFLNLFVTKSYPLITCDHTNFDDSIEPNLNSNESYSLKEYSLSDALKSFNYYDRLFGFFGSLIVERKLYLSSLQANSFIISNNYLNKLSAWSILSAESTSHIVCHFNYTPIQKRCSGPYGSYFQTNIDLQVQTFIYDQVFIFLSFSSTQPRLSHLGLNRSLLNLRRLLKYKLAGANFLEITSRLSIMNCPIKYLAIFFLLWLVPVSLVRMLKSCSYIIRF